MAEIFVIASGKGGVGKSSVTVGIGRALSALGSKVLLIDTDVGLRSLDLLIKGTEALVYDWGDIILGRCEPQAAVVSEESVSLLTCPREFSDDFTPEAFKALVTGFNDSYDYILIDSPAGIGKGLTLACSAADHGVVVATPDPICVRGACRTAEIMAKLSVTDTRLIINRFRKKATEKRKLLNIDSVIDETTVQLIGVVPEDSEIGFGSIYAKEQLSTGSFTRIAKRFTGVAVPLFRKQ